MLNSTIETIRYPSGSEKPEKLPKIEKTPQSIVDFFTASQYTQSWFAEIPNLLSMQNHSDYEIIKSNLEDIKIALMFFLYIQLHDFKTQDNAPDKTQENTEDKAEKLKLKLKPNPAYSYFEAIKLIVGAMEPDSEDYLQASEAKLKMYRINGTHLTLHERNNNFVPFFALRIHRGYLHLDSTLKNHLKTFLLHHTFFNLDIACKTTTTPKEYYLVFYRPGDTNSNSD